MKSIALGLRPIPEGDMKGMYQILGLCPVKLGEKIIQSEIENHLQNAIGLRPYSIESDGREPLGPRVRLGTEFLGASEIHPGNMHVFLARGGGRSLR